MVRSVFKQSLSHTNIAFFDVDGTLHEGPTLWELVHKKMGTWESHGLDYLGRYLHKEITFEEFAALDVACWKGLSIASLMEEIAKIKFYKEIKEVFELLKQKQIKIYLVTNNVSALAQYICKKYSLDGYFSNELEIEQGKLTGEIIIKLGFYEKLSTIQNIIAEEEGNLDKAMAFGDGEADIAMLNHVHYPFLFNPKGKKFLNYQGLSFKNWAELL